MAKPSTEHVVFEPAPGASVSFTGRLELDGVSHVTLSDFTLARTGPADRSLFIAGCTTDVTLQDLTGETFFVEEGTSQITFHGGSWGGYSSPGEADSAIGTSGAAGPTYSCGGQAAKPATDIVFDGVLFHDVFWGVPSSEWGGSHPDCFEINGYVGAVVVRNSRFVRCASTFMQINPDQGDILNATFEKNVYKQLGDESWYGIQITSAGKPWRCGNVIFRRNTYLPSNPEAKTWPNGPIRTDCEPSPGTAAVLTSDNLFQRAPPANECARYQSAAVRHEVAAQPVRDRQLRRGYARGPLRLQRRRAGPRGGQTRRGRDQTALRARLARTGTERPRKEDGGRARSPSSEESLERSDGPPPTR